MKHYRRKATMAPIVQTQHSLSKISVRFVNPHLCDTSKPLKFALSTNIGTIFTRKYSQTISLDNCHQGRLLQLPDDSSVRSRRHPKLFLVFLNIRFENYENIKIQLENLSGITSVLLILAILYFPRWCHLILSPFQSAIINITLSKWS